MIDIMRVRANATNAFGLREAVRIGLTVLCEGGETFVVGLTIIGIHREAMVVFGVWICLVRTPVGCCVKRIAILVVLQVLSFVPFIDAFAVRGGCTVAHERGVWSFQWCRELITATVHGPEIFASSRVLASGRRRAQGQR